MNGKRFLMTALCLWALAGIAFASGAGQQATSGGTATGGRKTLRIGLASNTFVTDFKDNYWTKLLEERHNVDLQFELLPSSDTNTKISLMVAGGDLPDIIIHGLSQATILDYGSKGAFIPLDKYFNNAANLPNFNKIPQEDRTAMIQQMTSGDGHMYSFVSCSEETGNLTYNTLYLNMAWIEKLGLKTPTTTDELRDVLIAFRDRDPNGNGIKDELGISGQFSGGYGENIIETLINSFVYYTGPDLALDSTGKKVVTPFTDPEFRAALQYLNGLFKEGLLSSSIFTNDQNQFRAELNNNPPILGLTGSGSLTSWPSATTNANFAQMKLVPPFKGPKGAAWSPYRTYYPVPIAYITYKAADPDFAFKFLESFYDHDLSLIGRFGREGIDWSRDPKELVKATNAWVQSGVYPMVDLVQTETNIWGTPSNVYWRMTIPCYRDVKWMDNRATIGAAYDANYYGNLVNPLKFEYYVPAHPSALIPQLKYTAANQERVSEPQTNVQTYVNQAIAEFITNNAGRDINNNAHWQTYLDELNKMGLETWVSTAQSTFDRMPK